MPAQRLSKHTLEALRLNPSAFSVEYLLGLAEAVAEGFDGHFTIMKFTTHWKCCFETLDLDSGEGRDEVGRRTGRLTLKAALLDALLNLTVAHL